MNATLLLLFLLFESWRRNPLDFSDGMKGVFYSVKMPGHRWTLALTLTKKREDNMGEISLDGGQKSLNASVGLVHPMRCRDSCWCI